MRKSIVTITAAAAIGFGGLFSGGTAHADAVQSLKEQKTDIQSERDSVKDDLSEAEAKVADVLIDIEDLNEKIKRNKEAKEDNEEKLDQTENQLDEANEEVDQLNEEVDELQANIEKRSDILHNRLSSLQENGGDVDYLEVIFGAKSFGDFISRVSAVNKITESDEAMIKEQRDDKKTLEIKQEKVESKLKNLEDIKVELKDMGDIILAQEETNADKKKDLKKKKSDLDKLTSKLEMKDTRMATLASNVNDSLETARTNRNNALETLSASSSNNEPVSEPESISESGSNSEHSSNASSKKTSSPKKSVPKTPSKASGGVASAISLGKQFIGSSSYVYGAKDAAGGRFDCSGFVSYALESGAGYSSVPRSTGGLSSFGTKVSTSQMKAGDLVFFDTVKTNGHVGIYLGGGKFLGSQSSTGVGIADMTSGYWKNHFSGHVRSIQ